MEEPIKPPMARPCRSCPYRKDVPSGVWHPEEYAKLPGFDLPSHEQPMRVFMCHQQDGRLCAGWCGTHDMSQNLGLRIAVSTDHMTPEAYEEVLDYECSVPLFETGADAARHGMAEVDSPGPRTQTIIQNLKRKGLGSDG